MDVLEQIFVIDACRFECHVLTGAKQAHASTPRKRTKRKAPPLVMSSCLVCRLPKSVAALRYPYLVSLATGQSDFAGTSLISKFRLTTVIGASALLEYEVRVPKILVLWSQEYWYLVHSTQANFTLPTLMLSMHTWYQYLSTPVPSIPHSTVYCPNQITPRTAPG